MRLINKLFNMYAISQKLLDKNFIEIYINDFIKYNNLKLKLKAIVIDEQCPYEANLVIPDLILYLNPKMLLDNMLKNNNLKNFDVGYINLCYLKIITHDLYHLKQLDLIDNRKTNLVIKIILRDSFHEISKNKQHYEEYYDYYPIEYNASIETLFYLIGFMAECNLFDIYSRDDYEAMVVSMIIDGINKKIVRSFYDSLSLIEKYNKLTNNKNYRKLSIEECLKYGFYESDISEAEIKKYIKR